MAGSIITRALAALFGPSEQQRYLFVGLDASGRTTYLYLLKLGEMVTTIPTIGFNVETVTIAGVDVTIWDVGGCDKIRPLWRHYFANTHALVFFVDSNDRGRVSEAREELHRLLSESELQDCVVLVLANKQDLPNAITPPEVRAALGVDELQRTRPAPITCLPGCSYAPQTYVHALEWTAQQCRQQAAATAAAGGPAAPRSKQQAAAAGGGPGEPDLENLMERWLEVEDEPDDVFLSSLADYTLDTWDHRTHLRIAWLLLGRHGRREGMTRIFDGIKAFIANSPRTKRGSGRGTTFHETMTYFWTHMVHYAMTATKNPRGDFKTFLLLNPQLANGGLFLHYYTKQLMLQTQEARKKVVLPDKRPLPSILTDVSRVAAGRPGPPSPPPATASAAPKGDDDDAFLAGFEAQRMDCWGHLSLLRVVHCYLVRCGRRRAVDRICAGLQALQKDGFNLTLTYFWIQMVTLALLPDLKPLLFPAADGYSTPADSAAAPVPAAPAPAAAAAPAAAVGPAVEAVEAVVGIVGSVATLSLDDPANEPSTLGHPSQKDQPPLPPSPHLPSPSPPLPQFQALLSGSGKVSLSLRKLVSEPLLYLRHYSKERIHSAAAQEAVVLPDKKQLPQTF